MAHGLTEALELSGATVEGAIGYFHDLGDEDGVLVDDFHDFALIGFWVVEKLLQFPSNLGDTREH